MSSPIRVSPQFEWMGQFRSKRDMFQFKFKDCWSTIIDSCVDDAKLIKRKLCRLLQPGALLPWIILLMTSRSTSLGTFDCPRLARCLQHQELLRVESLAAFSPVTAEVNRSSGRAPAEHCILDPVPTWLLKRVDEVV